MIGFLFLFCLLFRWGVLHRVPLVVGWCQVLYSGGFLCVSSHYLILPRATSCEELTHWKRLWCWEGLGAGGEEGDRGWDGWMASLTRWTWVWVNSRRWWWAGRPGVLRFMGSQRVGHNRVSELNWYDYLHKILPVYLYGSHSNSNLKTAAFIACQFSKRYWP